MPAKARDLFGSVASFPALRAAALRAAAGKRAKPGPAAFLANLETEVLRLERALASGRYRPGRYTVIELFDPKHRVVSAAPFRDKNDIGRLNYRRELPCSPHAPLPAPTVSRAGCAITRSATVMTS